MLLSTEIICFLQGETASLTGSCEGNNEVKNERVGHTFSNEMDISEKVVEYRHLNAYLIA